MYISQVLTNRSEESISRVSLDAAPVRAPLVGVDGGIPSQVSWSPDCLGGARSDSVLSVPQLNPPEAGGAQSIDLCALNWIGGGAPCGADLGPALDRLGENVAQWESELAGKVAAYRRAGVDFDDEVGEAERTVTALGDKVVSRAAVDDAVERVARAVAKEAVIGSLFAGLPAATQYSEGRVELGATAKLTLILAQLQQLISSSDIDALESQRKMLSEMSSLRQKSLQTAADYYAVKVAEAKQLQHTMDIVGQVAGWALAIAGVALAAFTGGASLVIAAAGLALMLADTVYKAIVGTSFIDEAMKPVVEKVVEPMMGMIADAVAKALEDVGVDKDKAELAGAIVGSVAMAIVLVAGMIVIGRAGEKAMSVMVESSAAQLEKLLDCAVVDSLKKMMARELDASGITSLISRSKNGFSRLREAVGLADLDEAQVQALATRTKVGLATGEVTVSGAQAGVGVVAANDIKDAGVLAATVTRTLADRKVISKLLNELSAALVNSNKALSNLSESVANTLRAEMSADDFVLKRARAV